MTPDDLNRIYDYALEKFDDFPDTDYRFTTLDAYIDEVSEFLSFTYAQKVQRLKARMRSVLDPVEQAELAGELFALEEAGAESLSHAIWGGVLVTIFSTYESSIQELLVFFEKSRGVPKFKKEARKSFIESADRYSKRHLKFGLYRSDLDKLLIHDLLKLRNSYVHNGCRMDLLPTKLQDAIAEKKYQGYSLGIKGKTWVANSRNTKLYFKTVYDSFCGYRERLIFLASN